jgi:hypothetical protein
MVFGAASLIAFGGASLAAAAETDTLPLSTALMISGVPFSTTVRARSTLRLLSTPEAAAQDYTGAALWQSRHERAVLDFETEIRKRRDAMHAEHLANMAEIFAEAAE